MGRVGKTENTVGESVLFLFFVTLQAACREKLQSGGKTMPGVIDGRLIGDSLGGSLLGGGRLVGDNELGQGPELRG